MVVSSMPATPRASGDCRLSRRKSRSLVAESTDQNGARRPIVENSLREPLGPATIDMIGIRIIRGVQRAQSS